MQVVGLCPFMRRLARTNTLTGWVLNSEEGIGLTWKDLSRLLQGPIAQNLILVHSPDEI